MEFGTPSFMPPSTLQDAPLLVAAFSRHVTALERAQTRSVYLFGPIAFVSAPISFITPTIMTDRWGKDCSNN